MSSFYIPHHNCVFIHIPKTGGLSIRKGFFEKKYIGPFLGKVPRKYRNCFSFCFVRNPYDRLISAWKMLTRDWQKLPQLSLKDFLSIVTDLSIGYRYGRTFRDYKVSVRHHTLPQTDKYNCFHLSKFVGRYENIQDDFKLVCEKIGCKYKPLPVINQSQTDKNYMQYFDDEILSITNRYYQEDFKQLKYPIIHKI
jgi:hypothetical protein